MEVIIRATRADAARLVAQLVETHLRANPGLVLGLATGESMEPVYEMLGEAHRERGLSFSGGTTLHFHE